MENKTKWFVLSVASSLVANILYGLFGAPNLPPKVWPVLIPVLLNGSIMGVFSWLHIHKTDSQFKQVRTAQQKTDTVVQVQQQDLEETRQGLRDQLKQLQDLIQQAREQQKHLDTYFPKPKT